MRLATFVIAAALGAAVSAGAALGGGEKPFIRVPKSWEAAVEEAKTLNVPIVVHVHGWN